MGVSTNWFLVAGTVAFVSHLAIGSWLTLSVMRAEDIELHRKCLQVAIVWLVPVLGAIAVHWFLVHGDAPAPKSDPAHTPQRPNHHGAGQYGQ